MVLWGQGAHWERLISHRSYQPPTLLQVVLWARRMRSAFGAGRLQFRLIMTDTPGICCDKSSVWCVGAHQAGASMTLLNQ
jgi:hypothetical protein